MPLLISGPYSREIAVASGANLDAPMLESIDVWEYSPWSEIPADNEAFSLGEWTLALRTLTDAAKSDDPSVRDMARRALRSPMVCTGHIDRLDALAHDLTSARLAGFHVGCVVVAGSLGSSVKTSLRDDQQRRMKRFSDRYRVPLVRMKGKRGGTAIDLRTFDGLSHQKTAEPIVHKIPESIMWTIRFEVPRAHRHVSACGHTTSAAVFALNGTLVFRTLPSLLARCTAQSATVDAGGVTMVFAPDENRWPAHE